VGQYLTNLFLGYRVQQREIVIGRLGQGPLVGPGIAAENARIEFLSSPGRERNLQGFCLVGTFRKKGGQANG